MPKFFVKNNQIYNEKIKITGEDVNHISNVLRMKKGDILNICNMDNSENFIGKIQEINKLEVICVITKRVVSNAESNIQVDIYQGLPKSDKMELIIQKSVELGASQITPVEMKRCIVKLQGKDELKKVERWRKIAEVAAKQCGRDLIPVINNVKNIKQISNEFSNYDLVLVCYENEKNTFLKQALKDLKKYSNIKIAVIIGPEGGIDLEEVGYMEQNGAKVISLGNRILRTETVALSMLSIIMYEFERNEL